MATSLSSRDAGVIDERFIDAWVERLRAEIPGAIAILLKGSHVRGEDGPWSDLDFDVLTLDEEVADAYLAWIVDNGHGRRVHVSVAVERLNDWLDGFREPATWSFGLPARVATRLLWLGRPSLQAELDRNDWSHPGGEPELEDFFESLGKARNAHLRSDELSLRLAVRDIAQHCPSLLAPLNDPVQPGTRPEALRAALGLAVAPDGYRDDMLRCLGLDGRSSTAEELLAAGERLVFGTLALLEANADTIGPLVAPYLPELLGSGELRRYLEQGATASPRGDRDA